jgi:Glycosyltransferase like family/Tetratricopeptide repeat
VSDEEAERLYAEAGNALLAGRLEEAERGARGALALAPELASVHYLLGSVLIERGEYAKALDALDACLERRPGHPLLQHARVGHALCRARTDFVDPPRERLRGAAPRISVVVCSITPSKFERVAANYAALLAGLDHEIVGVHDARSLAEGYNRGVRRARGEILVFSHDDIEIVAPDFAAKLVNRLSDFALVGVAGTDRVCGGSWIDAGWPYLHGQIGMPERGGRGIVATAYLLSGASASPMQALDGVFFACRRAVIEKLAFDERTFDDWHLYDLDFSYSAAVAGFPVAVANDILLVHQSAGKFSGTWLEHARRFVAKHRVADPSSYSFKGMALPSAVLRSAQEWRAWTHYMIGGR